VYDDACIQFGFSNFGPALADEESLFAHPGLTSVAEKTSATEVSGGRSFAIGLQNYRMRRLIFEQCFGRRE